MRALALAALVVGLAATLTAILMTPKESQESQDPTAAEVTTPRDPRPFPGTPGQVAFIFHGQVFWLEGSGKAPQQLTLEGSHSSPVWSASGTRLGYLRESANDSRAALLVSDGPGFAAQLIAVEVSDFQWSPTKERLAFLSADGLQVIDFESRARLGLASGHEITPRISWDPSGTRVAYGTGPELRVVDLGGNLALAATVAGHEGYAIPAGWGSYGRGLVVRFWQSTGRSASLVADGAPLYEVLLQGGPPRLLVNESLVHDDFVANSTGMAAAVVVGGSREAWHGKGLIVVDAKPVRTADLAPEGMSASSPDWAPDGREIVFVAGPSGVAPDAESASSLLMQRRLYLADPWGSAPARRLTNDSRYRDERPVWVGHERIVFARLDASGNASVWELGLASNAPGLLIPEVSLDEQTGWFGLYGHIDWERVFHVHR